MSNIKVIAHYFPQFHVIPENEQWWGKGFTDWTNVKKATPLFTDHYQPHVPDDYFGYYNLLDIDIQKKQIELAKQYGIYGFCFYAYWFNGKRLLEKPLDNYLENKHLDLPFCICWANENWSRRWDGRDQDLLIEQKYSEKDDIDFIEHMSKYLKDPRYIRINKKPLVMVYRPNILPNIKKTVDRWRNWCVNNDIGDIYLSYTQSFTDDHPGEYGFDAASEFPPNNGSIGANIEQCLKYIDKHNEAVEVNIVDWNKFLDRTHNYEQKNYTLFRCIMPSWDNAARKKSCAYTLVGSEPTNFQIMAENAFEYTLNHYQGDERIVFVNAWNEWGEGCHLEPDQKYGYSWLQAIKNAHLLTREPCKKTISQIKNEYYKSINIRNGILKSDEIAIIYHSFYPEYLSETLNRAELCDDLTGCWFIITAPHDKLEECKKLLTNKNLNKFRYLFLETNNKGKDILPFFKIYNTLIDLNIKAFCKIHSKKSSHRQDGDIWRKDLIYSLLHPSITNKIIQTLSKNNNIGMILNKKYTYSLQSKIFNSYSTYPRIQRLSKLLGINDIEHQIFPGGSMFWSRIESLIPMYKILQPDNDTYYPEESGQMDNTFAHLCERLFCISAQSIGLDTIFLCDELIGLDSYNT